MKPAHVEGCTQEEWKRRRAELQSLTVQPGPYELDHVEHLWSEGFGRALAADTVAGIQDAQPNVRKQLPATWRLLKAWSVNEVPSRAPPLPEDAFTPWLVAPFLSVNTNLPFLSSWDISVSDGRDPWPELRPYFCRI